MCGGGGGGILLSYGHILPCLRCSCYSEGAGYVCVSGGGGGGGRTSKSIIICKLAIDHHYGIMVSRSSILSQLLELSLIYVYVQVLLKTGLRDQGIS